MANRNLGSLTIDVIAKTGGFVAGMDKAARSASSNFGSIKKAASNLGVVVAAGFSAAAGAVALWTKQTIDAAVQIERLSELANTAPETFQRWAISAGMVGIEQQKLADILKDTQDKVGDFIQTGGGPLADFFDNIAPKVGVTAEQFRRLSGPDALQLYVSSLEKAKLSQSDMVFYLEAIASDSSLLLPILRDNGKALQEWGDTASDVGAILSNETIAAAKEARDQFAELGLVWEGIKNRVVAEVIPAFLNLTDNIFETGDKAKTLDSISRTTAEGIKILTAAGVALGGAFQTAGDFIGGSIAAIVELSKGNFRQALDIRGVTFGNAIQGAQDTADAIAAIWEERVTATLIEPPPAPNTERLTQGFTKAADKVKGEFEKAQDKIKDIISGIEDDVATIGLSRSEVVIFDLVALGASNAQIEVAKLALAQRDWLELTLDGIDEIESFEQERIERSRDVLSAIEDEIALMGMTIEQQEIYNNLKWAGVDAESERGKAIVANTKLLQGERARVEDQVTALDSVRDASKDLFIDIASGSKSFKESFGDAIDSIRNKLIALAAEKLIERIFGQNGQSSGGAAGNGLANIFANLFSGNRATGGPVFSGGAYGVGENGNPELLTTANGKQYLIPGDNGRVSPIGGGNSGETNIKVEIINKGEPMQVESSSITKGAGGFDILKLTVGSTKQGFNNGDFDKIMLQRFGIGRRGVSTG